MDYELGGFSLGLKVKKEPGKGLSGRFVFPPFSVLRANSEEWRRRKRQWLALGIESEIGRKTGRMDGDEEELDGLTYRSTGWMAKIFAERGGGTSIFDPVLCELMYKWFCPPGGQVVDPFAGGSVRGVVAAYMGYHYWGSELREEQVEANRRQADDIVPDCKPVWVCGGALRELKYAPAADFIFTCPPYGNLEVYSDLEEDLSNKEYSEFLPAYKRIIRRACKVLKNNRFACFVVANFRDKSGMFNNLVGDTVVAFESCGLGLYNELVLMTPAGSLPVRVGRQFSSYRKIGKMHQNILVFYKGDVKKIKELFDEDK